MIIENQLRINKYFFNLDKIRNKFILMHIYNNYILIYIKF